MGCLAFHPLLLLSSSWCGFYVVECSGLWHPCRASRLELWDALPTSFPRCGGFPVCLAVPPRPGPAVLAWPNRAKNTEEPRPCS